MTVSELSKKYNMQATDVDKYIQQLGIPNLAVTDPIPADSLASVEKMIQSDGHKPSRRQGMLIKKTKPAEDKAVAQVRKKIVIKKKATASGVEGSAEAGPTPVSDEGSLARPIAPAAQQPDSSSPQRPDTAAQHGRPAAGNRPQGDRPPYAGRPQGDRPPYAGRPQGDRPPYAGRPQGDRPPYAGRPQGDRPPYAGRPQGDRPPYAGGGQRPPYGSRPQGDRPPYAGGGRPPFGSGGRPATTGGRPASGAGGGLGMGVPPSDRRQAHKGSSSRGKDKDKRDRQPSKRWNEDFDVVRKSTFKKKSKRETQLESVPDKIEIMETLTVSELARKMNLPAKEIISKLMSMGLMTTINQQIDADTATLVASEYGCTVKQVSLYDETVIEEITDVDTRVVARPPIVTVMGHVDHGKTKLLDAIRSANVVASESGGITQHIGAYQVHTPQGAVTFIDTPGHEAFATMRARGAKVTDVVILVVAADDGVMPQTIEAAKQAIEANVPIVVAVNKMDKPEANLDRVKQQLADRLDLLAEDWGGKTMCVPVSAIKKAGISELLNAVLLQAEMLELKADPDKLGVGTVLEARIDPGKGTTVTVLCSGGSMSVGDNFVAGVHSGRIRAMYNDRGEKLEKVGPSTPAEILGSSGLPQAGDPIHIVENEKRARTISAKRLELRRFEDTKTVKKVTLENIFDRIKSDGSKELKVIIKADVQGSAEALKDSLEKIENSEVRLSCIRYSAGAINEDDVMLASSTKAIIIGFHVRPNTRARETAEREHVEIRPYTIIYDAINDIEAALRGMMTPELHEKVSGSAEVRDTFKVPKAGTIAGCYVIDGSILRNNKVRVVREGEVIFEGKVSSLKRFKDDAREVQKGYECGIGVEGYDDIRVGDILENYSIQEVIPGKGGKSE